MSAGSGASAGTAGTAVDAGSARFVPWVVPALRALVALIVGFVITFTPAHSAAFGLIAFGLFAVVEGSIVVAGALGNRAERRARGLLVTQGILTVIAGAAALVRSDGGVHYFVWVVSLWAVVAGALELVSGLRARGRVAEARDWMILGGLTLILAIAFLVIPPDYSQTLGGIEQIKGELTASVVLVGVFGAWAIVAGVLLGISAVSVRNPRPTAVRAGTEATP